MQLIMVVILSMVLAGCKLFTETVYVETPVPYTREPLNIEPPLPIQLVEVPVTTVFPDDQPPYVIIDKDAFKLIILNNQMIEGYMIESTKRIEACEEYYTQPISEW